MNMSEILHVHHVYWDGLTSPRLEATPVLIKIKEMSNITALINNTIKLLNPEIDTSTLQNLTNTLAEFSKTLSKKAGEGGIVTYNISNLEATYPNVPISDLLGRELGKVNVTLNDTDTLSVFHSYYGDLNNILGTADP
ncbi:uncharacterized protein LOC142559248 [Dermacentor variabilis]|uniref:uncharacterized protein LOC142559248 n=1 Tax=Dermacentor variabilis TaxID=34621 RepID=UPI003F5B198F